MRKQENCPGKELMRGTMPGKRIGEEDHAWLG